MIFNTNKLLSTSLLITVALSFAACVKQPAPQTQSTAEVQTAQKENIQREKKNEATKTHAYKNAMHRVGATIKKDAKYKKLNLNTPQLKNWFTDITYKVWDHKLSKSQFVALGLEKFPNHAYEFNLIADGLLDN